MSHLSSLNVTVHPALHNTLILKSDAIAKFGTICPVNVVGSPGMLMLYICVDSTCQPSRRLIVNGFVARRLFSMTTPSMTNMDVAPVSAMACNAANESAFRYCGIGGPNIFPADLASDLGCLFISFLISDTQH
jgi:hypothetical protein